MNATDNPTSATAYPVSKVVIGANKAFAERRRADRLPRRPTSSTNAAVRGRLAYMRDNKASPTTRP